MGPGLRQRLLKEVCSDSYVRKFNTKKSLVSFDGKSQNLCLLAGIGTFSVSQ